MERSRLKQWMWLIAYSIGLIIIVVHSGFIAGEVVRFLKQLGPLIGGVAIAFVLNKPYERLKHFLHTKMSMPAKAAGAFAMAGVYLGVAGAAIILFRLVLPNLIENVQMLFKNTDSYIEEFEQFAEKILGFLCITIMTFVVSDKTGFLTATENRKKYLWCVAGVLLLNYLGWGLYFAGHQGIFNMMFFIVLLPPLYYVFIGMWRDNIFLILVGCIFEIVHFLHVWNNLHLH